MKIHIKSSSLCDRSLYSLVVIKIILMGALSPILAAPLFSPAVQQSPAPAAETSDQGVKLTADQTSQLISVIIESMSTWRWLFTGAGKKGVIKIKEAHLGMYQCGPFDIFQSSTVQVATLRALSLPIPPKSGKFYRFNVQHWIPLLGASAVDHKRSPRTQGRFAHVSQAAAQWFAHLRFNPNSLIHGYTLENIYTHIFRRMVRLLYETHLYLIQQARLDFERESYVSSMKYDSFFDGAAYLYSRFSNLLTHYNTPQDCFSPSTAVGFWLRRDLDGSRVLLWKTLQSIVKQFDPIFMKKVHKKIYPILSRPRFGGALKLDQLKSLYENLLSSPYRYMFKGEGKKGDIIINKLKLDVFEAGINGFLDYDALSDAAAKMLNPNRKTKFADRGIWVELSGVKLHQPLTSQERHRPFSFYHPSIIRWGVDQLIPPTDLEIYGYSTQTLYTHIFSRFFRLMLKSYIWLETNTDPKQEKLEYALAMLRSNFNGITYLSKRYKNALTEFNITDSYSALQPSGAIGFWVRRKIDGTAPLLWGGLKILIKRFDPKMFELIPMELR